MKQLPPKGQAIEPFGGSSFGEVILDRGDSDVTSNVLLTISNPSGSKTVLITPDAVVETSPKHFVDTPPERVITGRHKAMKKLSSAGTVFGYVVAAVLVTFSLLSATGYVKARVVLTGSMQPTISPGDIVLTAPVTRVEPKVDDVAAYQARRFDGAPVGVFTHRIIGGDSQSGWILQGDANPSPDVQKPTNSDILGVVIFVIPWLGNLLSRQVLFTVIPLIAGLWFLLDTLREVPNE
jgi:signal peptidase I